MAKLTVTLEGVVLLACSAVISSEALLRFGYDQGVFSGVLISNDFLVLSPETKNLDASDITDSCLSLKDFFACLASFRLCDSLGRKHTIWLGLMCNVRDAAIHIDLFSLPQQMYEGDLEYVMAMLSQLQLDENRRDPAAELGSSNDKDSSTEGTLGTSCGAQLVPLFHVVNVVESYLSTILTQAVGVSSDHASLLMVANCDSGYLDPAGLRALLVDSVDISLQQARRHPADHERLSEATAIVSLTCCFQPETMACPLEGMDQIFSHQGTTRDEANAEDGDDNVIDAEPGLSRSRSQRI